MTAIASSSCQNNIKNCQRPIPTTYTPIGEATLWHNGQEISTGIDETIRNAANTSELRHYMQTKYQWSEPVADTIDWMIHAAALQNFTQNRRKTLTQLIHEWLPVKGHPGRHLTNLNRLCPTCKQHLENQEHFLSCELTKNEWESRMSTAINTAMTDSTHTHLRSILLWALLNCRDKNIPFTFTEHTRTYRKLIQEQTKIGWNQLLKGRWSTEWVKHLETTNPTKGERTAIAILTQIWNVTLTLWTDRCDKHDTQDNNKTSTAHLDFTQQIAAIYDQKSKLDLVDKQPLNQPFETITAMPHHLLKRWIKCTESFVKEGLQGTKRRIKLNNHTITNFFLPRLPHHPPNPHDTHTAQSRALNPDTPTQPNAKENQRPP
jgi:hypothetical protein